MNKKVWARGVVFISFFLLVSCSLSLHAQDEKMDALVEEEDIFYEVEDEEILEEIATEEEIGQVAEPFKEVEEEQLVATEETEGVIVQEEAETEPETEEIPLLPTETEEMEAEDKIAEPEKVSGEGEKYYTIRTWNFDRDCLWNIADHFYKNPWEWQKIWKANPYI